MSLHGTEDVVTSAIRIALGKLLDFCALFFLTRLVFFYQKVHSRNFTVFDSLKSEQKKTKLLTLFVSILVNLNAVWYANIWVDYLSVCMPL